MKKKVFNLSSFTSQVVGQGYDLGTIDCLQLLRSVVQSQGGTFPEKFEGITLETYADYWNNERERAKRTLFRLLSTLGKEILPGFAFAGDILVLRDRGDSKKIVGFHGGGSNVFSAFTDVGIQIINVDAYEIIRAYRVVE